MSGTRVVTFSERERAVGVLEVAIERQFSANVEANVLRDQQCEPWKCRALDLDIAGGREQFFELLKEHQSLVP